MARKPEGQVEEWSAIQSMLSLQWKQSSDGEESSGTGRPRCRRSMMNYTEEETADMGHGRALRNLGAPGAMEELRRGA